MTFSPAAAGTAGGTRVRTASFSTHSTLPLSAACLVANGVRERLCELLAADLDVELIEPAIPAAEARRLLVRDATVFRVRGQLCDGFVVLRAADARRLVALAFGESDRPATSALSDIEGETVERIARALVPLCNTLCGALGPVSRESTERVASDFATYFEVRTRGPGHVTIGFALTHDPPEPVTDALTLDHLADVEIRGRVEFAAGSLSVPAFSRLARGATVVLDTPLDAPGVLRFGDVAFALGTCGVANGRSAIAFGRPEPQR